MPLPKSASIGARATDVYSESCPLVMDYIKERGGGGEGELPQLLPYLRQLLTCCACAGLLKDPMVSLSCGHCYCYECQFSEPLLKIHCRQCRGREGLVINNQLRLIASLYRELIHLLGLATPTDHALQELVLEVTEGVKVSKGLFYILPPTRYRKLTSLKPLKSKSKETSLSICTDLISDDDANITDFDTDADLSVNEDCIRVEALTSADRSSHFKIMRDNNKTMSSSSSPPLHISIPLNIKRRRDPFTPSLKRRLFKKHSNPVTSTKTTPTNTPVKKKRKRAPVAGPTEDEGLVVDREEKKIELVKREMKYNCRCGTNPGVMYGHLICMKKKCPCFYNELPCIKCRCKGCCNPFNK